MFRKRKRVFLDYAATTPLDKRVEKKIRPLLRKVFANPSSPHTEGLEAKKHIQEAKEVLARIGQIKDTEVVFTSGGTESINLAVLGIAREVGKEVEKPHIITTNIEHPAVLESCNQLEREGFEVTYVSVDSDGLISPELIMKEIKENTILISIMLANNEIGTLLPIREISKNIKQWKNNNNRRVDEFPYLHTDACQAANYVDINLNKLGVDALSIDGSKIYGPKGIGALIIRGFVPITNILYGGKQSRGLRPGTEDTPGIVGLVEAMKIADMEREGESKRLQKLQAYFISQLTEKIPEAKINGDLKNRLPNNVNVCIPGINSEFAVIQLDEVGIACSAASACSNLSDGSSKVISALNNGCEKSSLRFSMGRDTSKKDIYYVIKELLDIVAKKR